MNKIAICIKNGYMDYGRQFCIDGKKYPIIDTDEKYYYLNSESSNCHSMSYHFFKEYFIIEENIVKKFSNKEFKI